LTRRFFVIFIDMETIITFILKFDKSSGLYASKIKEYPNALSQGKTEQEAIHNVIDALFELNKPTLSLRTISKEDVLNIIMHFK
jgi:predicted RNase H-like HicB family nuclease